MVIFPYRLGICTRICFSPRKQSAWTMGPTLYWYNKRLSKNRRERLQACLDFYSCNEYNHDSQKRSLEKRGNNFLLQNSGWFRYVYSLCKCKLASRIHSYRIYPWSLNQSLLSTSYRFISVFIARTPPSSTLLSSPLLSSISAVSEIICA